MTLEAGLTAILMIVILAVATDTRAVGSMAAIAIGATIAVEALVMGPITGASMSYWIGPIFVSLSLSPAEPVGWLPLRLRTIKYHVLPLLGGTTDAVAPRLVHELLGQRLLLELQLAPA